MKKKRTKKPNPDAFAPDNWLMPSDVGMISDFAPRAKMSQEAGGARILKKVQQRLDHIRQHGVVNPNARHDQGDA
jgi:hypothetical protein